MRNPSISSSGGTSNKRSKTTPCCSKVGMKRGPWTPEEDELLAAYIKREGEGRWRTLPKKAGLLRCGKSCRLRWMNYLRPDVKRGHIDSDEEDLILRLHRLLGNKWSLIAGRIPGRTDNEIKNYWNSHLSKKLISQGIDPRTHKPLNPNNSSSDNHSNLLASSSKPNHNQNPNFAASEGNHDQYYNDQNGNIVDLHNSSNGTDDLCNAKEDDIDCGGDDVFSSFLNSLINEEMFNGQNQQYQLEEEEEEEEEPNHIVVAPGSDLLKSSSQTNFALDAGWEAPNIMSCASALNPYDVPESHEG